MTGAPRAHWDRTYGAIALREVHDHHGLRLEMVRMHHDGTEVVLAFKPEELPALMAAIRDSMRRLLGHPKHRPHEYDEILRGTK